MTKTFVQLHGTRIKRISNRMDGPGYDCSDPMASIRRRRERRNQAQELSLILADPDTLTLEDDAIQPDYLAGRRKNSTVRARGVDDFYQPERGKLVLQRSEETGMITFASYSARGRSHHRRRHF